MTFKNFLGKKEEKTKQPDAVQTAKKQPLPTDEPPPAVQLESAMVENARQDTPDSRSKVYQELLFSNLLLALVDNQPLPQPSADNPDAPQNLNVAIMSNPQGIQFAAAFTSAEAAKRWRVEGGQYVSIRGQDIFKLLEPSPAEVIVVNAGSAPFVTLSKAEYRSLAQGIVPQASQSPVQAAVAAPNTPQGGMQISFPPDAFTDAQKEFVQSFLSNYENVEAAALGALLPPNAPTENSWLRTIFLRTTEVQKKQEDIQKFCIQIRDEILKTSHHFSNVQFEVGIMPDNNFWLAVHSNNFSLFDKNPPKEQAKEPAPKMPPSIKQPGVRKA